MAVPSRASYLFFKSGVMNTVLHPEFGHFLLITKSHSNRFNSMQKQRSECSRQYRIQLRYIHKNLSSPLAHPPSHTRPFPYHPSFQLPLESISTPTIYNFRPWVENNRRLIKVGKKKTAVNERSETETKAALTLGYRLLRRNPRAKGDEN